jgi:acetyltransferase-like isoleucine patch superfamily enzyme
LIASHCYIGAGKHQHKAIDVPIVYQGIEKKGGVKIGRDVWLGTNVTVTDGVSIGDGAVVGAYSLVNNNLPPNVIAYGIPAEIKGERTTSQ